MEEARNYSWRSAIQAIMVVYREYCETNRIDINELFPSLFIHDFITCSTLPSIPRLQEISEWITEETSKNQLSSTPNPSFASLHELASVLIIIHTLGILEQDTLRLLVLLRNDILYWHERKNATKGYNPLTTTLVELWEGGPIEWYHYMCKKLPSIKKLHYYSLPILTASSSHITTTSMLPQEYVAQLELLQIFLIRLVGMCRTRLAQLASITTTSLRKQYAESSSMENNHSTLSDLTLLVQFSTRSVIDIGNCILASTDHSTIIHE